MRETALPALAIAAALVVAAVAGAGFVHGSGPAGASDSDSGTDRTISVTAQGSAEAAPDQAVVRVAVVATGDDPAAVRDELADGAADLRENLEAVGVDEDDVETTDYDIRQPRSHRDDRPDDPEYRGAHAFRVTVDDPDDVGTIVDAAADAGAQVQQVRFTLSEERRTELRDRALENAMEDADRQAETLAAAGGLEVTGVAGIDATDRRYSPVSYDAAAAERGGGGDTTIESGDVSVSTTIRVTYNATDG